MESSDNPSAPSQAEKRLELQEKEMNKRRENSGGGTVSWLASGLAIEDAQ
jgi:hypothetical protein